jgi:hypothetical protein
MSDELSLKRQPGARGFHLHWVQGRVTNKCNMHEQENKRPNYLSIVLYFCWQGSNVHPEHLPAFQSETLKLPR